MTSVRQTLPGHPDLHHADIVILPPGLRGCRNLARGLSGQLRHALKAAARNRKLRNSREWYDLAMSNIATSVRINEDAMDVLSHLATKLGKPKAQVIELALKELEEKTFWADVHRAFEESSAEAAQSAEQNTEIALWERVSETDFRDEKW